MSTATVSNLSQYNEKRVILTVADGEDSSKELEGKVVLGNELGIMFKAKGKASPDLIEASKILGIALAPEKDRNLKARVIKNVELGQARSHLLERHGFTLTQVNELTEEAALEVHAAIDHKAADLGHVHGDKAKATEATDEDNGEPSADEQAE